MSKLTLDPQLRAKLNGLNEQLEICDETGQTVGHYLPDEAYKQLLYDSLTRIVLSAEAARSILQLEFSADDKERMHVLAAKAREGTLTPSEQEEIRSYERVGNLLGLMHSKARLCLKKGSQTTGPAR